MECSVSRRRLSYDIYLMPSQVYQLTVPDSLAVGGVAVYEVDKGGGLLTGCGRRFSTFERNREMRFEVEIFEGDITEVLWNFGHLEVKKNNFQMTTSDTILTLNFTNKVSWHFSSDCA